MQIDLKELSNQDIINIDESVDIPKEYLQNTAILDLKKVSFVGKLFSNSEEEMLLEGNLEGVMVIQDSYSLDLIDYSFQTEIEEFIPLETLKKLEKNENTLDITEILWQNIVLEVPISYSKDKNIETLSGEGWELRDKNTKKIDSRFAKLTELLEKGKE